MSIKSGTLFKKGSGKGFFPRRNWKPRHCVLTMSALNYYDRQDGHLKGSIDLTRCSWDALEIMPCNCPKTGQSASTGWRIAIQTHAHRYFIAATSEREMYDWALALASVITENRAFVSSQSRIVLGRIPKWATVR
ncbi:unnamed protein product [Aphanomyces euteiches]